MKQRNKIRSCSLLVCIEQNKLCLVTGSPDGTLGVIAVILHYCNILDKAQWFILSPLCFRRLCFSPSGSTADPAAHDPWDPCRLPLVHVGLSQGQTGRPVQHQTLRKDRACFHLCGQGSACLSNSAFWLVSWHNLIFFNPDCLLLPSVLLPHLPCLCIGLSSSSQLDHATL